MLQDVIERVGLIPQMLEQLNRVDTSLAVLFDRYFGLGQIQLKIACPKEIRHLFRQVGICVSIIRENF